MATNHTRPVAAGRTPRFGVRLPADGTPPHFKILISIRWIVAGVIAAIAAPVTLLSLPWRTSLKLSLSAAAGGLIMLGRAFLNAGQLRFERVDIPVRDLPLALDGLRIVQLSDMHLGGRFAEQNTRRAVEWTMQRRPDMIALTGDFIMTSCDEPLLRDVFRSLHAPHGVYAIFGNHDYWDDVEVLARTFDDLQIDLLRNEQRLLRIGDAALVLVGLDCQWELRHDVAQAIADLPSHATTIVLAHEPDIADEMAESGAVLQLSGHTHAGHISAPFLGPLFLPRHGTRYFRGLQRIGGMWLYVSRGLGGFPLRMGAHPEATELTLRRS